MRVRIVASVAEEGPRPSARPTRLATHRRDRSDQFHHRHHVGDVRRCRRCGEGNPVGVGNHLVFAPFLSPVHWAGPSRAASAPGPHEAAVDDRSAPVDLASPLQLGQQNLVELGPDASHRPVAQAAPARHARTATHFDRKILPVDSGLEDEQDAGQSLPVLDGWAAGTVGPLRLGPGREQGMNALPEGVGDEGLGQDVAPNQDPFGSQTSQVPCHTNQFC